MKPIQEHLINFFSVNMSKQFFFSIYLFMDFSICFSVIKEIKK